MDYQFFEILTYFVIYSFGGWVLESVFRSISERKIINTGFLMGPFCPIYGIGAIIMLLFLERFNNNVLLLFAMSFIILSIWEYLVGVYLEKAFHTKYWDYSDHKFNLQGRVCLTNSICWGILGVLFIRVIHPFVAQKLAMVDMIWLQVIIYSISFLILIDAIVSIVHVKNLRVTLDKIEELNKQIKEKLEEFNKEMSGNKEQTILAQNVEQVIHNLNLKKNHIIRRLYRRVYRLKKAFPAIDTKEITEVLNKKIEIVKKEKELKNKKKKKGEE